MMRREEERCARWLECCAQSDECGECPQDCPAHDILDELQDGDCEKAMKRHIAGILRGRLPRVLNPLEAKLAPVAFLEYRYIADVRPCRVQDSSYLGVCWIETFGSARYPENWADYGELWRVWSLEPNKWERAEKTWGWKQ